MLIRITDKKQESIITSFLTERLIDHQVYRRGNDTFIHTKKEIKTIQGAELIHQVTTTPNTSKEVINIGKMTIFSENSFNMIAGPCAIETEKSLRDTAAVLQNHRVKILRGGANKLRTSPYSYQGKGAEGIVWLSDIAREYELFSMTEITEVNEIDYLYKYIDIFLIGTRNMFNYTLLKELSKQDKPVILKRGMAATIKEWLLAAEYLSINGKKNIILCERGIRTFDDTLRNTFDLAAALYVLLQTPYFVITDPSHATGNRSLITPLVLASKAAGLSGAMIEIHPKPDEALSDGQQMLNFEEFEHLIQKVE
ncbi:MAG: 3-deoxy-7-phosphoheptulonate synthase [Candidatus Cloacimonetes bacterium]|nr:3-deoxy-7-phosphoheptulonate synthase [Candidatus Cloacimonadota bacterium]